MYVGPLSFGWAFEKSSMKLVRKQCTPIFLLDTSYANCVTSLRTHCDMSDTVKVMKPLGKVMQ